MNHALNKLEKILSNGQVDFFSNLILPHDQGYLVFGRFSLDLDDHKVTVRETGRDDLTFGNIKSAMSWCVAMKYSSYDLANEIVFLDQQINLISQDMAASRMLIRRMKNWQAKQTVQAKLSHKQGRSALLNNQLDKCARQAKYLQIKGFNDEIARTRRTAPNKTNNPGFRIAPGHSGRC